MQVAHGTDILESCKLTTPFQVQLLACLKWLGEFQVLPCVPLKGCISVKELSALADAPERLLYRVIRMTATAGFLHEPEPFCVAHTPLSAAYTEDLSSSDAAMFLAHYIAPSALQLKSVSHQTGSLAMMQPTSSWGTASGPFMANTSLGRSQRCRQWAAYCKTVGTAYDHASKPITSKEPADMDLTTMLRQLEWPSGGNYSIVHVSS